MRDDSIWLEINKQMALGTSRANRATRFANETLSVMRDFVPCDRECRRLIYDYLIMLAFKDNLEIISVPPEYDALNKLELERMRVETRPVFVVTKDKLT